MAAPLAVVEDRAAVAAGNKAQVPAQVPALAAGSTVEEADTVGIHSHKGAAHGRDCMDYIGPRLDCLSHPNRPRLRAAVGIVVH